MTQSINDKTKQYYLDQLEILNGRAFHFYMINKKKGLTNYQIKKKIWYSTLWREAKILFKELNTFIYGSLTCEICLKGFYSDKIGNFQLHHDLTLYNWKDVFNPKLTHVVHKMCHKKELHFITADQL